MFCTCKNTTRGASLTSTGITGHVCGELQGQEYWEVGQKNMFFDDNFYTINYFSCLTPEIEPSHQERSNGIWF